MLSRLNGQVRCSGTFPRESGKNATMSGALTNTTHPDAAASRRITPYAAALVVLPGGWVFLKTFRWGSESLAFTVHPGRAFRIQTGDENRFRSAGTSLCWQHRY